MSCVLSFLLPCQIFPSIIKKCNLTILMANKMEAERVEFEAQHSILLDNSKEDAKEGEWTIFAIDHFASNHSMTQVSFQADKRVWNESTSERSVPCIYVSIRLARRSHHYLLTRPPGAALQCGGALLGVSAHQLALETHASGGSPLIGSCSCSCSCSLRLVVLDRARDQVALSGPRDT